MGLGVPPAWGTKVSPVAATCCVCLAPINAYQVDETNSANGVDRDFCAHAEGEQPVYQRVWTCVRCLYSGRPDDFYREVNDSQRAELRARLLPYEPVPADANNYTLKATIKYDLALQTARILQQPPAAQASLALDGAWAARLQARDLFLDAAMAHVLAGTAAEQWPEDLDPADRDLRTADELLRRGAEAAQLPDRLRATLALYAAKLYRIRGELPAMERALDRLRGWDAEGTYREEAELLVEGASVEKRFLRAAAQAYDRAVVDQRKKLTPAYTGMVLYLMGECYRRLGAYDDAIRHYDAALEIKETFGEVKWLANWQRATAVAEQQGLSPPQEPPPLARERAAAPAEPAAPMIPTATVTAQASPELQVRIPRTVLNALERSRHGAP